MNGKDVVRSQTFFNPWLTCEHPEVEAVVARAVEEWEREAARSRIRKRRDKDREAFRSLARTLVANAAHALALGLEPPTVAIRLAKPAAARSRYDGPGFGQMSSVLAAISPNLVTVRQSRRKGIASMLEPGDGLKDCIAGLDDFGNAAFRQTSGEVIVVRHIERNYAMGTREGVAIDYKDNEETIRLRSEVNRINAGLESAQLGFDDPSGAPVDIRKRRLRRIFNTPNDRPRFDLGGRLADGWWENLERTRRHAIRIEGEPVADLDFRATLPRLAYIRAGLPPPAANDDPYAGILGGADEARWRPGLKIVVNGMLWRSTPLQRLPKGTKELLPQGRKAASLREAILERHAPIRDQFEAGIGGSLTRLESDILVAILLRLLDLGIAALPMHDGLMVRHGAAERAASVMREVSKELTGYELPVKVTLLAETIDITREVTSLL
jgi:hypothetical protein